MTNESRLSIAPLSIWLPFAFLLIVQFTLVEWVRLNLQWSSQTLSSILSLRRSGEQVATVEDPLAVERMLPEKLPDFTLQTVHTRKQSFVSFMLPYVEWENTRLTEMRRRISVFASTQEISAEEIRWMRSLADQYGLVDASSVEELTRKLLLRVDTLPPSLVLAQAAIESGWGTSKFARKGNNLFGQWCMVEGCGLVPAARPAYARHEVQSFGTVQQSIRRYFMNLNTNPAYRDLREIRACLRSRGVSPSGPELAHGLAAYSGRGKGYVNSVRSLIYRNKWHELDGVEESPRDCKPGTSSYETSVAIGT